MLRGKILDPHGEERRLRRVSNHEGRARSRPSPASIHISNSRRTFAFSRLKSPELCFSSHPLSKQRAQGRPGAGWHPLIRCAPRNAHAKHSGRTGQPRHPAFPAQWLERLMSALSPETNSFLPPSPCELAMPRDPVEPRCISARLGCSDDSQDHTVWPYASSAVRPHAVFRSRRAIRPAIILRVRSFLRPPQPSPRS